ncbi:MAG: NAD-dependent deacylase [Planctomycetota bacterium]|nr:MAG: NAD-dependent deacylase [Planctomycetota bacterium]
MCHTPRVSLWGIRDELRNARCAIAFTGAGISVPSGIPDFRSGQGIWARYPPEEFATVDAFLADPERWWGFFRALGEAFAAVEPNPAHRALAELEALGLLEAVVTQNVDGLHQRAGSRQVIELHGSPDRLRCLDCERSFPGPAPLEGPVPRCDACGQVLKPDVVLFGELLPEKALARAQELARASDACLVVGTSAVVYPAATIPLLVGERGGAVCQIDPQVTELGLRGAVRWAVRGDAAELLPQLVELLRDEG